MESVLFVMNELTKLQHKTGNHPIMVLCKYVNWSSILVVVDSFCCCFVFVFYTSSSYIVGFFIFGFVRIRLTNLQ